MRLSDWILNVVLLDRKVKPVCLSALSFLGGGSGCVQLPFKGSILIGSEEYCLWEPAGIPGNDSDVTGFAPQGAVASSRCDV